MLQSRSSDICFGFCIVYGPNFQINRPPDVTRLISLETVMYMDLESNAKFPTPCNGFE